MSQISQQKEMRAVAIDAFGGPEVISVKTLPVPKAKPDQILISVESAGVGVWDAFEREGMFAKMFGAEPSFPMVLGSEGAGKVVAVGDNVKDFKIGDLAYGHIWMRVPKGGFYAQYAAIEADAAFPIPSNISPVQAGPLIIDGATALRGLDDTLGVKPGEKLLIFGASGGLGHLAVQLAVRMGAHVFAIASGEDGVQLVRRLGAEAAVDGRTADVVSSEREFAPNGFDAALITAAGDTAEKALTCVRGGGRVAYPWINQRPAPKAPSNVQLKGYNGNIDRALIFKLNKLIEAGPFEVHLGGTFSLDQMAKAYQAAGSHKLGRLAVLPGK